MERPILVSGACGLIQGDTVLPGSAGALGYRKEDVAPTSRSWNGKPLTLGHPHDPTGRPTSADEPGIWDRQGLGILRNMTYSSNKLGGEAWFLRTRLVRQASNFTMT